MDLQQIDLEILVRFLGRSELEKFLLYQENEALKKEINSLQSIKENKKPESEPLPKANENLPPAKTQEDKRSG